MAAIVLNGSDVIVVTNLRRKYNKIINNPNMKILEECNQDEVDEKLEHWKQLFKTKEEREESEVKYYFKNKKTNETITSIYDNLDYLRGLISNIDDYERTSS
jgi:hypothetical protein